MAVKVVHEEEFSFVSWGCFYENVDQIYGLYVPHVIVDVCNIKVRVGSRKEWYFVCRTAPLGDIRRMLRVSVRV